MNPLRNDLPLMIVRTNLPAFFSARRSTGSILCWSFVYGKGKIGAHTLLGMRKCSAQSVLKPFSFINKDPARDPSPDHFHWVQKTNAGFEETGDSASKNSFMLCGKSEP